MTSLERELWRRVSHLLGQNRPKLSDEDYKIVLDMLGIMQESEPDAPPEDERDAAWNTLVEVILPPWGMEVVELDLENPEGWLSNPPKDDAVWVVEGTNGESSVILGIFLAESDAIAEVARRKAEYTAAQPVINRLYEADMELDNDELREDEDAYWKHMIGKLSPEDRATFEKYGGSDIYMLDLYPYVSHRSLQVR